MQIKEVDAAAVRPLRQAVLRPHQRVEEVVLRGDDAADTLHLAAYDGAVVVGVATVTREPCPGDPGEADWRVRGMAVSTEMRRHGIGALLLSRCEAHARQRGGKRLWCHARVGARSFYERAGLTVRGGVFLLPEIGEHVAMSKPL